MASLSVLVCRGCCCGTELQSGVDHGAQVDTLRASLPAGARLWTVDCLGPCSDANVVVVRSAAGRTWLGGVLDPADTTAVADWIGAGAPAPPPPRVAARRIDPDDADVRFVELDIERQRLVALLGEALEARLGSWAVGVVGATAEWLPDATGEVAVDADRHRLYASSADGALTIEVGETTRCFVARRRSGEITGLMLATPARRTATTVSIGTDRDGAALVDLGLGIGSCTFAVRPDTSLLAGIAPYVGRSWTELVDVLGAELVAASPPRVVATPVARIDVRAPIPPPDGESPSGSHTHLLPAQLELGRELPSGYVLPDGLSPGVSFHPPADWSPIGGWPI